MNVPNDHLNAWRAFVELARASTFAIRNALATGDRRRADEALEEMRGQAIIIGAQMEEAGALRPGSLPPPPDVRLAHLDTPANRRYERALQEAWEAGKEVDRERHGDDIGSDGAAQVIEMVLSRVRIEIHGPQRANE